MRPAKEIKGILFLDVNHKDNLPLINAARALQDGAATEGQQKMFFDALMNDICRMKDLSFNRDSEHLTAFNEGRRHVGMEVAKLITAIVKQETKSDE